MKKALCINCRDRPGRLSPFCTMRCGFLWARSFLVAATWCSTCKEWHWPAATPVCTAPLAVPDLPVAQPNALLETEEEAEGINPFDIPVSVRRVLSAALQRGVLQAEHVYALATEHRENYGELVNRVIEIAHMDRHSEKGRVAHAAVVQAAEEYWKLIHGPAQVQP